LLSPDQLVARLRDEGVRRYHDQHPFHQAMHAGALTPEALRTWTANRFYYQTRIPIKDALIVAKSEDPAFRRAWLRRIQDHDGAGEDDGGLALWLRLAEAVGLEREVVISHRDVLPGVLVVAVASSLTEMFAPDLMSRRIEAWEQHYPWVGAEALGYFRARVPRARRDGEEALAFVIQEATSRTLQEMCVAALVRKTEILWHLLDCVQAATATAATLP
jgi:pyrroloquinoline-quinone synthase